VHLISEQNEALPPARVRAEGVVLARTLVEIRDAIFSAVSAFHDFFMRKIAVRA